MLSREELIKDTEKRISESIKRDIFIIQIINSIDELNKILNTTIKRLREYAGYIFPEFAENTPDDAFIEGIIENNIPKEPMSMAYTEKDISTIITYARMIKDIIQERDMLHDALDNLMESQCKNLKEITGSTIGARLISLAGSFKNLSRSPASKIQLLGAEKALFRHLKTGAKSPKHGVIHEHPMVLRAKNKGKAARALADKISIATKVDYFKGDYIADKLISNLQKRFGKW